MGGRRFALLGAMLLVSGALGGCLASPDDSDDDSEDIAVSQQPVGAPPVAGAPADPGTPGATTLDATATRTATPDVNGDKEKDPEPSPWYQAPPGVDSMDGSDSDNPATIKSSNSSPSHGSHGNAIRPR